MKPTLHDVCGAIEDNIDRCNGTLCYVRFGLEFVVIEVGQYPLPGQATVLQFECRRDDLLALTKSEQVCEVSDLFVREARRFWRNL